jgi:predicted nucleic acid-binding protein
MKIGLDTSVVLRLLVGEPAAQAKVAQRRVALALAAGGEILVSDLVAAEAFHALHYHYGVPKDEARAQLRAMLRSGVLTLEPPDALAAFEPSHGAGLVDRLIVARHRGLTASTWTFDRKLGALDGVERLPGKVLSLRGDVEG